MNYLKHFGAMLLLISSATSSHAAVIVAPHNNDSNIVSVFGPFSQFSSPNQVSSMRYQEVYAADEFSELSHGGGFITGVGCRIISGSRQGGIIPNLQIDLSTTARTPDALSTSFAENVGADNRSVIGARSVWIQDNTPEDPTGFGVFIQFDSPFFYDPARGNLLMDVRNIEAPPFVFSAGNFEGVKASGDSISSLVASDVAAKTGNVGTSGMTTAFVVEPIPEPSTVSLVALALPLLFFAVHRSKQQTN